MWTWLRRRVGPALLAALRGWSKNDGALMSAAMSFYAAFALFPLVLVLIAAVGFVLRYSTDAQFRQQQVIDLIAKNVSPWLAEQISGLMLEVQVRAEIGAPVGFVILIVATLGIFMQLETMFARIEGRSETPGGWLTAVRAAILDRLVAFVMLVGVAVLLICIFVADNALSFLRPHIVALPGGRTAWWTVRAASTIAGYTFLLGLIYRIFPRTRVRWREALGGGLLVALIWKAGQAVLESLVIGRHYSAYGVVGSFIAVMLWMYYASAVVFLGANFVQAMCQSRPPHGAAGG